MNRAMRRHGLVAAVLSRSPGAASTMSIADALATLTGGTPFWLQVKAGTVFIDLGGSPASEEGSNVRRLIRPGDNSLTPVHNYADASNTEQAVLQITGGNWFLSSDGASVDSRYMSHQIGSSLVDESDIASGPYTIWAVIFRSRSNSTNIPLKSTSDAAILGVVGPGDVYSGNQSFSSFSQEGLMLLRGRGDGTTAYFASSGVAEQSIGPDTGGLAVGEYLRETNNPTYTTAGDGFSLVIVGPGYTAAERARVEAAICAEYGCAAIPG